MHGNCFIKTTRAIDEVVEQNPDPKRLVPMFTVISIPSTLDDFILGERVYVRENTIYSCMTDESITGLRAENLMFDNYVRA